MEAATRKFKWDKLIVSVLLIAGGLLVSIPFLWMVLSSFKTEAEVLAIPPSLLPESPTVQNYKDLFTRVQFDVYLWNTLIIVFFSMFGLVFNTMAGYGFGKFDFRGREFFFLLVLSTMMIPAQVTMIPIYLLLNEMGLTNTMAGIVLPGLTAAFNIFLIRQFMTTIPDELLEAARIDGANEAFIFVKLIIPMAKPILAVQTILTFIAAWNSFLWPLIVANEERLYPLTVGLALLQGQHASDYALQMAGATFMVVPILIIFSIFQKHIVKGINVTGLK